MVESVENLIICGGALHLEGNGGDRRTKEQERLEESGRERVDKSTHARSTSSAALLWRRFRSSWSSVDFWSSARSSGNDQHAPAMQQGGDTQCHPAKQQPWEHWPSPGPSCDKLEHADSLSSSLDSVKIYSLSSKSSDNEMSADEHSQSRSGRRLASSQFLSTFHRKWKKAGGSETLLEGSKGTLEEDYELRGIVGKGQFGVVCACMERATGRDYACKTILKENLHLQESLESLQNEVEIQRAVQDHPNIVKLRGVYEDEQNVNLIMDYCSGGTLMECIAEKVNYSERAVARLLRDIVKVVDHCHKRGVVHRDIKLTNFMLADKSDDSPLMAIDFGVSSFFKPGVPLTKIEGSPFYIAPEVLEEQYGPECDIWSCGVCLYILLSGEPPFNGGTVLKTFKLVKEAALDFEKEPWMHISAGAKDLISRMLCRDPSKRPTAEEILAHPWTKESSDLPDVSLGSVVLPHLRDFCAISKLQDMARMVSVSHPSGMTSEDRKASIRAARLAERRRRLASPFDCYQPRVHA